MAASQLMLCISQRNNLITLTYYDIIQNRSHDSQIGRAKETPHAEPQLAQPKTSIRQEHDYHLLTQILYTQYNIY